MIIATSPTKDGGQLLILGLTPSNLKRLRGGEPVFVPAERSPIPGLAVAVVFGQTERHIAAQFHARGVIIGGDVDGELARVEAEHRRRGTTP